jgi:hypothetical protein
MAVEIGEEGLLTFVHIKRFEFLNQRGPPCLEVVEGLAPVAKKARATSAAGLLSRHTPKSRC